MKMYTVTMNGKPESSQYVYPRIKISVSKEHADKIKAKIEQLKGINYVLLNKEAMTDATIDVCSSNLMLSSEVQALKRSVERICAEVTNVNKRRKTMKKYDIEIDCDDMTGTISVGTEQRKAVCEMLNELPYVDKVFPRWGCKTQIGIYISPLAEPEDLVEMGAKIAEIVGSNG